MSTKAQAPVAPTTTTTTASSAQSPPPTVKTNRSISLNSNYLKSPPGLFRILLIVFYFGGWVSAASIPKIFNGQIIRLPTNYEEVRSAYLFFTIVGFIGSIILYLCVLLKFVHAEIVNKLPWILLVNIIY
jgi:hypothetical protein